jgi:hypothetical protein
MVLGSVASDVILTNYIENLDNLQPPPRARVARTRAERDDNLSIE